MALGHILLNGILWDFAPEQPKLVTISYRNTADPDVPASYTIVSTSTWADISGYFTIPVTIENLDTDMEYTVKVVSSCGGYTATQNFVFTPDGFAFSLGFSLGFDA